MAVEIADETDADVLYFEESDDSELLDIFIQGARGVIL